MFPNYAVRSRILQILDLSPHSGEGDPVILDCDAMQTHRKWVTFRWNIQVPIFSPEDGPSNMLSSFLYGILYRMCTDCIKPRRFYFGLWRREGSQVETPRRNISLHCQPWRWRQCFFLKCSYQPLSPHGVIFHKTNIDIFTNVRTFALKMEAVCFSETLLPNCESIQLRTSSQLILKSFYTDGINPIQNAGQHVQKRTFESVNITNTK
jgi:hypothetical protein